ncbi:MAG: serine/threonine phosphatase, partial [Pseudanabaenaceae cyanobacterium bins.68]|nr:serine/threonine phosphatase [Pseudanabaenaceae cyanobacterium bins.68]
EITKVIQPKPKVQLKHLAHAGLTDVGQSRDHNEDDFVILSQGFYRQTAAPQIFQDHKGLFIVCDGMGGHDGGEVASALAIAEISQHFQDFWQQGIPSEAELRQIILKANQAIFNLNEQESRRDLSRMGTTLVLLAIHNLQVAIAHVGDSRIYRVTSSKLEQLTRDHEVANRLIDQGMPEAMARARYDAHQLTQALGPFDAQMINPSLNYFAVTEPTLFLLCSDGLCDEDLVEKNWQEYLLPLLNPDTDLKTGVQELVSFANYLNGHDNITAIAVQCLVS